MRNIYLAFLFGLSLHAHAQQAITVSGEVTKQLKLTLADIGKYPPAEVKAKDRDGKEHSFKGVALATVLDSAGVTLGKDLRGENLAKYVIITAADNYQVVYSLAEVDPEFTSNTVLLCTHVDGNLLPRGEGPFRVVNLIDKRPARWIREITSIKVAFGRN
jgi:DMSO/TMAO reductase YedYZ molybdopterin-dependent catalytic subunit